HIHLQNVSKSLTRESRARGWMITRRGENSRKQKRRTTFARLASRGSRLRRARAKVGEAGIRTLGRAFRPYNGLANRRLQPLGHLTTTVARRKSCVARGEPLVTRRTCCCDS